MGDDRQPTHVFVSYVREDRKEVDLLCDELIEHGVNVWLDRNSLKPGMRWRDAIREAIQEGDFFIACFSKVYSSKRRTHMNQELNLAIEVLGDYPTDRAWFIPVLLEECDVPARSIGGIETLLDIQWVALYADWDAGIRSILDVIQPIPREVQKLLGALDSEDVEVRKAAANVLANIAHPGSVTALIEALHDEDSNVRRSAADALGRIAASVSVPALVGALHDEDKDVRRSAADALGKIGDSASVPALIEALNDWDGDARGNAAIALGKIGDSASVPALIEALHDEDWHVRGRVFDALGKIADSASVPALMEALHDEDRHIRAKIVHVLGRIRDAEVVPVLIQALSDEDLTVYYSAAIALRQIGTPEALKAVEEYSKQRKPEKRND